MSLIITGHQVVFRKKFYVEEIFGTHRTNLISSFSATVTGGKDEFFGWYCLKERISWPSILAGILIQLQTERATSICLLNRAFFPFGDAWSFDHKGNMSTFIAQKLFSAGMAYSMVGKKYDYSVLKNTFFLSLSQPDRHASP